MLQEKLEALKNEIKERVEKANLTAIIAEIRNDYLSKNIDYLTLTISDDEQRIIKDLFPALGDIIKIWVNCQYWYKSTDKPIKHYFGAFFIDNISANFPPSTVTIRARALPLVKQVKLSSYFLKTYY